ncbi:L,D-transpeptidase [Bartonella sp. LJL80]
MKSSLRKNLGVSTAIGLLGLTLAGCTTTASNTNTTSPTAKVVKSTLLGTKPLEERYEQSADEPFKIPPVTVKIPEQFQRTIVSYPSVEAPGTIIVEPQNNYLYLVTGNGKAIRYGVGVGAAGLGFQGVANLQFKRKWPKWTPTPEMVERNPGRYKRFADGVPGGLTNPLGARALYLFQNNIDTYYRIHGTTQPSSIGKNVSAGCIRMLNKDVIDLYERVQTGAKVIVR